MANLQSRSHGFTVKTCPRRENNARRCVFALCQYWPGTPGQRTVSKAFDLPSGFAVALVSLVRPSGLLSSTTHIALSRLIFVFARIPSITREATTEWFDDICFLECRIWTQRQCNFVSTHKGPIIHIRVVFGTCSWDSLEVGSWMLPNASIKSSFL